MPAINKITRSKIKGYLDEFIQGLIEEHQEQNIDESDETLYGSSRKSNSGKLKPFHSALIPSELIRINQFERSFSTKLGSSIEECARLIATENHKLVHRGYDLIGQVSESAYLEIERQKDKYESSAKEELSKPSFQQMVKAVLDAQREDDLKKIQARVDLYVLTNEGTEYLFEIKSPKPNKGQCLEVLHRLLKFHLLRINSPHRVETYYAMPYNPYGSIKSDYKWSCGLRYIPFNEAVLIGHEFWQIVGGTSAYEELMDIYREVGREKGKDMIDSLAFNLK